MALDLARFAALRPWAYHMTAPANLGRIGRSRRLACAADLLAAGGRPELVRERRRAAVPVLIDGEAVVVEHQRPLHAGAIRYDAAGWDFGRYVEHLNRRVFFWPGRAAKLVPQGESHLQGLRAAGANPGLIRVSMSELLTLNAERGPWVSRCNSGAPRGKAVRGAGTFVSAAACDFPPTRVAELTFEGHADLPAAEVWTGTGWEPLSA